MQVTSYSIDEILKGLKNGEWTVPSFQREFVWSTGQVCALAESVMKGRPIGIATFWILQKDAASKHGTSIVSLSYGNTVTPFSDAQPAAKQAIILDGRQRSTALSMAFGGLRTTHGKSPYAGAFFADLDGEDESWVVFKKKKEIQDKGLDSLFGALGQGLLPLAFGEYGADAGKSLNNYLLHVLTIMASDNGIYPAGKAPSEQQRAARIARIHAISAGVSETRLAACELGDNFDIADICDVFETLNQTGVKVSTVDLLHATLYNQLTDPETGDFFNLRAWWDELGQSSGAERWSASSDSPERIAQMVAAAYAAKVSAGVAPGSSSSTGGKKSPGITSRDILDTPPEHWREIVDAAGTVEFAQLIGDFQDLVVGAGMRFPATKCPYPSIASVYVGLRWSRIHQGAPDSMWDKPDLDVLFRAYFWNSVFYQRYDQGMAARVAADIQNLRLALRRRAEFASPNAWRDFADRYISELFAGSDFTLTKAMITEWCFDGATRGARRDGILLPVWARPRLDFLSGEAIDICKDDNIQLHHIWPKAWIATNKTHDIAAFLAEAAADNEDRVNSAANLMPLTGESNNWWKSKVPAMALNDKKLTHDKNPSLHDAAFLDKTAFGHLLACKNDAQTSSFRQFLEHRAQVLADWLFRQTMAYIGETK